MASYRVLIVDDSGIMRKLVERSLRSSGLVFDQILHAGDGAEGLATIQRDRFDFVLSDMNMPNMSGLQLVQAVAQLPKPTPPIILVTTEAADEPNVAAALSAGAAGHLKKPFSPEQLHAALRQFLPL